MMTVLIFALFGTRRAEPAGREDVRAALPRSARRNRITYRSSEFSDKQTRTAMPSVGGLFTRVTVTTYIVFQPSERPRPSVPQPHLQARGHSQREARVGHERPERPSPSRVHPSRWDRPRIPNPERPAQRRRPRRRRERLTGARGTSRRYRHTSRRYTSHRATALDVTTDLG